jgi:polyhydroxyalkanoate synthase
MDRESFDATLTLNPVVGVTREDIMKAALTVARQALVQPAIGARHALAFFQSQVEIAFGRAPFDPDPKDARFSDPGYSENRFYRSWVQTWLALGDTLGKWVDEVGFDPLERERARFLAQLATDALAPSNFLLGNPSAIRKALETRGASLASGLRNFLDDLRHNDGMPSQVDKSAFRVGENVATTEGAVVFRHPILELLQYKPLTERVESRPVFIVPPQINKYYVYDMSPEKSLVRYLVSEGFQVFMVSWRNPTAEHRDWGLADYIGAIDRAIDATCAISGSSDVDGVGACAGGITFAAALGYFAATGRAHRVASLTLMVNVLDSRSDDSVMGLFATDEGIENARKRSAAAGVLDGRHTARIFNWMRPNDLIWNYVVSNYLHGESPPAFDILYWNNDTTRLPARLHSDFLDIFKDNALTKQGALRVHDLAIDLKKVTQPVFITGGTTDHITPWQACYRSTRLFGGPTTYVLSTAGHIQSLINPPGSGKRKFYVNDRTDLDAETWRDGATERSGSWWPFWASWLRQRSTGMRLAPSTLGGPSHQVLASAPGTYVFD